MTPEQLAIAVAGSLCSFLGKAGEGAGGELGKQAVASATALWDRLRGRWSADPTAVAIANKVELAPEGAASKSLVQGLLVESLARDPHLVGELSAFLKVVSGVTRTSTNATGERAVAIGGANFGVVETGDVEILPNRDTTDE